MPVQIKQDPKDVIDELIKPLDLEVSHHGAQSIFYDSSDYRLCGDRSFPFFLACQVHLRREVGRINWDTFEIWLYDSNKLQIIKKLIHQLAQLSKVKCPGIIMRKNEAAYERQCMDHFD